MATPFESVLLRVHDSGDYFSPWYFRAMQRALNQRDDWIIAYGYTKRIDLLQTEEVAYNYSVLQSVGGKLDDRIDQSKPHAKVFLTEADRSEAGYADGNTSDIPAVNGESVGLVYHGNESVSDVDTNDTIQMRGGIQASGSGWVVSMPMYIKKRRLYTIEFDFTSIPDNELHRLITVKTGNSKVTKTAAKLSELDGIKYRPTSFDLPALASCPMAGACAFFCYALQGTFGFKSVRYSRARTWAVLHEAYKRGGEAMVEAVIGAALDTVMPKAAKARAKAA